MPRAAFSRGGAPLMGSLTTATGWALAVCAVAVGYVGYGWQGVALAVTVIAFWLLLQFSRALRALRAAAGRPVGSVESAVMLHTKLHTGMRLAQVLKLTRSLGHPAADSPETFAWRDAGGDEVRVVLRQGRTESWALQRAGAAGAPPGPHGPQAPTAPT